MKPSRHILSLAAAFVAGALVHAAFTRAPSGAPPENARPAAPPVAQGQAANPPKPKTPPESGAPRSEPKPAAAGKTLTLPLETVDALLAATNQAGRLSRMGLTAEQLEAVSAAGAKGLEQLKKAELSHSSVANDANGEYVVITPFPEERGKWLADMEAELRAHLGDDRAGVIARMIAFSDNDEKVGLFRREVFATPLEKEQGGATTRIEEKTFNAAGALIDTDYELLDGRSRKRWDHILELGDAPGK